MTQTLVLGIISGLTIGLLAVGIVLGPRQAHTSGRNRRKGRFEVA